MSGRGETMIDPCTWIGDIEEFALGAPDAEWTGKPFEPREAFECLYLADMPLNHFPEAGEKEER